MSMLLRCENRRVWCRRDDPPLLDRPHKATGPGQWHHQIISGSRLWSWILRVHWSCVEESYSPEDCRMTQKCLVWGMESWRRTDGHPGLTSPLILLVLKGTKSVSGREVRTEYEAQGGDTGRVCLTWPPGGAVGRAVKSSSSGVQCIGWVWILPGRCVTLTRFLICKWGPWKPFPHRGGYKG
jgi:hypothetical protein